MTLHTLACTVYLLLALLLPAPVHSAKHFLCVLTKVKAMTPSSGCNLLEWLEYHLRLGVDHFWVTDDCSPPSGASTLLPILAHYQALGAVTLVKSYTSPADCLAYRPDEGKTYRKMFSTARAREQCDWMLNLDYDEYLTWWRWGDALHAQSLRTYLTAYPYSFVRLPWWVLGNFGHEAKPAALVIESYQAGSLERPRYVKTIARVADIVSFQSPHLPQPAESVANLTLLSTLRLRVSAGFISPRVGPPPGTPQEPSMTIHRYAAWNTLHEEEKVLMALPLLDHRGGRRGEMLGQVSVPVPATELFVKHYKYLSWEGAHTC